MEMGLVLMFLASATDLSPAESGCFRSDFLQGERRVDIQTRGNQVRGTFPVQDFDLDAAQS